MNQQLYYELGAHLPVVEEPDVLVCGGGPAGLAAAVAAAQAGARTRLIEAGGCLGGIWTRGLLAFILDADGKGHLLAELLDRVAARGGHGARVWGGIPCDPEVVKLVAEQWCHELGIGLRLHTNVVAAHRGDGERQLRYVVTESKSGREAWAAKVFVDCTGDGDLAARAGCGFDLGRPGSGQTQPMSLIALLGGVSRDAVAEYVHRDGQEWRSDSRALCALLAAHGVEPSYGSPILLPLGRSLLALMANHQYGARGVDAQQVTDATVAARAEVHRIVDALRASGGAWSGVEVVATAPHIGVREGRRIHGRYQVTEADVIAGRRHADAVCRVCFPVDVHATNPDHGRAYGSEGVRSKPYDIPLRALIAADVDGLLMAGRCISGDFLAHASYRVTGVAVQLGQAAGTLAAVAATTGRPPHLTPFADLPGHADWTS